MGTVTDDDRSLLEFEDANPRNDGAKEKLIRDTFGLSNIRYYQRLNRVIRDPEAIAAYPLVASRTIRRLETLARKRSLRQL
jgi:hypothetical protein